MDIEKNSDFVNVAIRIKPDLGSQENKSLQIIPNEQSVLYIPEKDLTYSFDNVFSEQSTQEDVYKEMVKPLVNQVLKGFNATVFAYGQTGTGKTYTVGTNFTNSSDEDCGIIIRALKDIICEDDENKEHNIYVSFYEIYNKYVYDLLNNFNIALPVKGFKVNGLTKQRVYTCCDAEKMLREGSKHRHIGETKQNSESSRSHAIFTIYYNAKSMDSEVEAKLNLVDLAGSESIKKTGNQGNQLHEGININQGLLSIGQVIEALSSNKSYIPYRTSIITSILRDSLSKKNFVAFIACVKPTMDDVHETVQTLDFAQRAKRLKTKPELNTIVMEFSKNKKVNENKLNVRATPVSTKVLRTPLARSKTPFKPQRNNLSAMKQRRALCSTLLSNSEYKNSRMSVSMASISSIQEPPISYSPIVNKCVEVMEKTIMQKFKTIISETLETPLKQISTSNERVSWSKIQSELSKLVKHEINQLKSTESLEYSVEEQKYANSPECQEKMDFNSASPILSQSSPMFKIPEIMPKKKNDSRKSRYSVKTSSPILRRSTRKSLAQNNVPVRRSMRISQMFDNKIVTLQKEKKVDVAIKTPVPTPRAKVPSKSVQSIQLSKNAVEVLHILNNGTEKDFLQFNTVGTKTAKMLSQYREIIGEFKNISDLAGMPWKGASYQRFLDSNFIKE